jgi:RGM family protein
MRSSTGILFAALCLLASAMMPAEAVTVTVYGLVMTEAPSQRLLTNVVAFASGSSTPITPTIIDYGTWVYAQFDFEEGTYEIQANEPGFYRSTETVVIDSSSSDGIAQIYLVPLAAGVTILNHPNLAGASQWWAYFTPNLTLPASAGFSTSHINPYTSGGDYGPYNFGTAPASIISSFWTIQLIAANEGTYRLYTDAFQFPTGFGLPEINYTLSEGVRVSVFAGTDPVAGVIGHFKAQIRPEISWYVGDIVVTNPSFGCSRYHWVPVDSYGYETGFDQTNHGSGTFFAEQCVDVSPAALACTTPVYESDVDTVTCGAFGDPHIITFDGNGVTCGFDKFITLLDNDYLSITADTVFLNSSNNATAISSITLTYKGYCNPTSITFDNLAQLEAFPFNSPNAYSYTMRISGNNAYIDALHLRLQVRRDNDAVVFGISIPTALAAVSSGICVNSCPTGTLINEGEILGKRDPSALQMALDACTDAGLTQGTFEYQACLFDVSTTSNTAYAADAVAFSTIRAEVSTPWEASPTDSTSPSSPSDPGAASASLPSFLALAVASFIATLFF